MKPGTAPLTIAIVGANGAVTGHEELRLVPAERLWAAPLRADAGIVVGGDDTPTFLDDLREARMHRSERGEIAGWPVFIIQNGQAFHESLAEFRNDGEPAFGDMDVRIVESPLSPADLIAAARDYRERRQHSRGRLLGTLAGALAVVVALVAFAIALTVSRSSIFMSPLAVRVEDFRAGEGVNAAARLQEPLQAKIDALASMLADADFPNLSPRRQRFVRDRLGELSAYRDYAKRLAPLPSPLEARSESDLTEIEQLLNTDLTLPAEYAKTWHDTEAAMRRRQMLGQVKSLQEDAKSATAWYRQMAGRAQQLLHADPDKTGWPAWGEQAAALMREPIAPPIRTEGREAYAAVMAFAGVAQARTETARSRKHLAAMYDLATALGAVAGNMRPAVLALPDSFAITQSKNVLEVLQTSFPSWKDWSPKTWPDSAVAVLRPKLAALQERLLEAGRRELASRAKRGSNTPEQWRTIVQGFADAPENKDWRELTIAASRWLDPNAVDPVTALIEFLARDRFEIALRGARLTIPDDLPGGPWQTAGRFIINAQRGDQPPRTLAFRQVDDGVRDAKRVSFAFAAEGEGVMTVYPGDVIWAELPVRNFAGEKKTFSWWANGIRSPAYQFDRLNLPPRIHAANESADKGALANGVSVTLVPERDWPKLPELLPRVR